MKEYRHGPLTPDRRFLFAPASLGALIPINKEQKMLFPILHIAFCLFFLLFIARVLSHIEKRFVQPSSQPIKWAVRWSLSFFKVSRFILFLLASIEVVFYPNVNFLTLILGIFILMAGMYLRIAAIKELGPLWSYHACLFENHYLVDSGIYRWLQHPAYIGNIHIPGLILAIGAPLSAIMAFLMVIVFYLIRIRAENQLLSRGMEIRGV